MDFDDSSACLYVLLVLFVCVGQLGDPRQDPEFHEQARLTRSFRLQSSGSLVRAYRLSRSQFRLLKLLVHIGVRLLLVLLERGVLGLSRLVVRGVLGSAVAGKFGVVLYRQWLSRVEETPLLTSRFPAIVYLCMICCEARS